ncbi:hypothetical protein QCE81_38305 [Caballeronia sp. LZ002]|nr:hypothetical protein [Caballeronia sp. LZ002]MDR5853068.1 hypothetical protein [Caballeronia sp. LZ003]
MLVTSISSASEIAARDSLSSITTFEFGDAATALEAPDIFDYRELWTINGFFEPPFVELDWRNRFARAPITPPPCTSSATYSPRRSSRIRGFRANRSAAWRWII